MELRKDYVLDRWAIISEGRTQRPHDFRKEEHQISQGVCYFCPGSEHLTPPEISRVEAMGNWKIRVFENKFPAVELSGTAQIKTDNNYFTFSNPYGKHEVVVETNDHGKQLHDLGSSDLFDVLQVYCQRIKALSQVSGAKYVVLFKNFGPQAGTSLVHSHTQILSINLVPTIIQDELQATKNSKDGCPYCRIIETERRSYRRCFESGNFVAFTPYASRFNYEIWLFPKKHHKSILELNYAEMTDLAVMLEKILGRIKDLGVSYNFYLHNSPAGEDMHFHFEFTPRIANWAGFELGTSMVINSVPPEKAAMWYRGEK